MTQNQLDAIKRDYGLNNAQVAVAIEMVMDLFEAEELAAMASDVPATKKLLLLESARVQTRNLLADLEPLLLKDD